MQTHIKHPNTVQYTASEWTRKPKQRNQTWYWLICISLANYEDNKLYPVHKYECLELKKNLLC